ncbi:NADase-type glycan-binding domain-containing protein [Nocardioides sp. SYSU DS0651]|uniref:NADase-type glycan-binding domain-containing protein n=1 Tax=Nocardioides sp. SYSU DS0651 TaxID=3415955 RepID=UPI003F4B39CA
MTTPTYCTSCGHELGIGRYCTNCGMPVPGRHPEAAPGPAAPVTVPVPDPPAVTPAAGTAPPAARYPLYADGLPEGAPSTADRERPASLTEVLGPPVPPPPGEPPGRPRGRRWPWLVGALVPVLALAVAAVVVLAGSDEGGRAADPPAAEQTADDEDGGGPRADADGTEGPVEQPDPEEVVDLTDRAQAEVPAVAPPSRDRQNNPVDFEAANLTDGRPRTSWRMAGDGTGETITFDLGGDVVLTEVGLINGYAKVDGPDNWYRGNRRIRTVQWELDDGSRITQQLEDGRALQPLTIDPVETSTVTLHLVAVTPPGTGPNGRDFTAISEVRFLGAPA